MFFLATHGTFSEVDLILATKKISTNIGKLNYSPLSYVTKWNKVEINSKTSYRKYYKDVTETKLHTIE